MKQHSTKKALLASVLALCLCFTMLVGTTFAWFTDNASSNGNVITTGKLDVEMYWAEGAQDPANTAWNDTIGAIFTHTNWEPGYIDAKHIKIANEGTLALKYQMRILANGVVSELADVIDVYYFADATQIGRANFTTAHKLGTLSEVLNVQNTKFISNAVAGALEAGDSKIITLAFKMQEDAGNEYQELSIGSDFSIQILATQYTFEGDSFDNLYDNDADFAPEGTPSANVFAVAPSKLANITIAGMDAGLDTGYSFQPTETFEQASESEYEWAHADFYIYADNDVPANSLALAGYYQAFEGFPWEGETCTSTSWIGLTSADTIAAGQGVRLLYDGMGLPGISYSEICQYGNDGIGFLCGATDLTGENEGTTLTVELRLYKVGACGNTSEGHHHNSADCETGEYVTVGKFTYTFDAPEFEELDDGSIVYYADNGEAILYDASRVEEDTYYIPDGITALGNYAFAGNDTITEVIVSEDVVSLGRAFDSNTSIKKVVLNEGLETIDSRAFKSTTALEEVVIPSTVTVIEDNAFQKSAIKNIVIPATVATIGETAFGGSAIESVTFEGNTAIEGYAFRGCANLRTVIMNGDDNLFVPSSLNGRNSMWFCNGESNNPNTSNITFYVQNTTVATRVKVAMGAEANNTPVIINGEEANVKVVKTLAQLQAALDAPVDGLIIGFAADITGNVEFAQDPTIDLVIDGCGFELNGAINIKAQSNTDALGSLTIKNINFKTTADELVFIQSIETNHYPLNITVSGCTFEGTGADSNVVAISIKSAKNFVIENCTATNVHSLLQNNSGWNLTVRDVTVTESGRGLALGTVQGVTVSNATIDVEKYGIRLDAGYNNNAVIADCDIEAFIPVVVRKVSVNSSVTFNGENTMTETNTDGIWCAIGASEYEANGVLPTAAAKTVTVTVNDTTLDINGIYNNAR